MQILTPSYVTSIPLITILILVSVEILTLTPGSTTFRCLIKGDARNAVLIAISIKVLIIFYFTQREDCSIFLYILITEVRLNGFYLYRVNSKIQQNIYEYRSIQVFTVQNQEKIIVPQDFEYSSVLHIRNSVLNSRFHPILLK